MFNYSNAELNVFLIWAILLFFSYWWLRWRRLFYDLLNVFIYPQIWIYGATFRLLVVPRNHRQNRGLLVSCTHASSLGWWQIRRCFFSNLNHSIFLVLRCWTSWCFLSSVWNSQKLLPATIHDILLLWSIISLLIGILITTFTATSEPRHRRYVLLAAAVAKVGQIRCATLLVKVSSSRGIWVAWLTKLVDGSLRVSAPQDTLKTVSWELNAIPELGIRPYVFNLL